MKNTIRCKKCILPSNYPGISFGNNGICSLCAAFNPPHYKGIEKLKSDVETILRDHPDREYDCVIGTSGGRDSSYLLHILTQEMKLKPLAFLIDHDFIPEHTRTNVQKMTKKAGVDLIVDKSKCLGRCFPSQYKAWKRHPSPKTISAFCMGCKSSVIRTYYTLAIKHKIPILIVGDTPLEQTTYKMDLMRMGPDSKIKYSYFGGYVRQILKNPFLVMNPYSLFIQYIEFSTYFLPYQQRMAQKHHKHQISPFREYIHWKEKDVVATIQKEYDWMNFPGMVSTWRGDCYLGPMRQYFYRKFLGYSDKTAHLSELIRDGQITRDEALARLDDEELITEEVIKTCCSKTGMDLNELNEIFKKATGSLLVN